MADTVRLRNVSGQDRHVAVLGGRLVADDCVVEIPARLLNHQSACTGTARAFDPATGDWSTGPCAGCLVWPAETWRVESEVPTPKVKG